MKSIYLLVLSMTVYAGGTIPFLFMPLPAPQNLIPINYALSTNGGVASASSSYNDGNYPPSAANNGDRTGAPWGGGGGWNDDTNSFPDWWQVNFHGPKSISEIDVFTIQDNYAAPSAPTPAMTFSTYGITDFEVQYWNGASWVDIPGGNVSGNNLVWRQFTFSPITTDRIRVNITGAADNIGYSRLTEVEAWGLGVIPNELYFFSGPKNLEAFTCSSVTTVGLSQTSGTATTVNLSGAGVQFFSDSNCLTSITSKTIAPGATAANFYFKSQNSGTVTLNATTTSVYGNASQDENVTANLYRWTGAGGDSNWNNGGNWSGGSAPGSGQIAYFTGICGSCDATVNVDPNVNGINLAADYTGTITQGAGVSISLGASGWTQVGGTFHGTSGDIYERGNFNLGGGTFRSTSSVLYFLGITAGCNAVVSNPSSFVHNSGAVAFGSNDYGDGHTGFFFDSVDLYDLYIQRYTNRTVTIYGTINTRGTLYINTVVSSIGGAINAYGNITLIANLDRDGAATVVNIVGNGAQTLTGGGTSAPLRAVTINKTGGTLSLVGNIAFASDIAYVAGTVNAGASTIYLGTNQYVDQYMTVDTGAIRFNNVITDQFSSDRGLGIVGTIYVDGDLTISGSIGKFETGTFEVKGNTTISSDGTSYTGQIKFTGSGAQTISVSAPPTWGDWNVAKPSGTLTLSTDVSISHWSQSLNVTSGSIDLNGKNLTIGSSLSLGGTTLTKNGGVLTVAGTPAGTGALFGGTVNP